MVGSLGIAASVRYDKAPNGHRWCCPIFNLGTNQSAPRRACRGECARGRTAPIPTLAATRASRSSRCTTWTRPATNTTEFTEALAFFDQPFSRAVAGAQSTTTPCLHQRMLKVASTPPTKNKDPSWGGRLRFEKKQFAHCCARCWLCNPRCELHSPPAA